MYKYCKRIGPGFSEKENPRFVFC